MKDTRYPRVEKFMKEHPEMNLDQAIEFVDKELAKYD